MPDPAKFEFGTDPTRRRLNAMLGSTTILKHRYEAILAWLEERQAIIDRHEALLQLGDKIADHYYMGSDPDLMAAVRDWSKARANGAEPDQTETPLESPGV